MAAPILTTKLYQGKFHKAKVYYDQALELAVDQGRRLPIASLGHSLKWAICIARGTISKWRRVTWSKGSS